MALNIIARKPRTSLNGPGFLKNEWAVVERKGEPHHPFVVCTVNQQTLKFGEWWQGYYHATLDQAMADFNAR